MQDQDTLYSIGQVISKRRQLKKLTQQELSALVDLSRSYVSEIEQGKRNLSLLTLERLTSALDLSLTEFMREVEAQQRPNPNRPAPGRNHNNQYRA